MTNGNLKYLNGEGLTKVTFEQKTEGGESVREPAVGRTFQAKGISAKALWGKPDCMFKDLLGQFPGWSSGSQKMSRRC